MLGSLPAEGNFLREESEFWSLARTEYDFLLVCGSWSLVRAGCDFLPVSSWVM